VGALGALTTPISDLPIKNMTPIKSPMPDAERTAGSLHRDGYTYAIVILETLAIKQFTNKDDLNAAIEAKGKDNCVILKWHDGAQRWVMPEVYA